jgi:hypothetical protein
MHERDAAAHARSNAARSAKELQPLYLMLEVREGSMVHADMHIIMRSHHLRIS